MRGLAEPRAELRDEPRLADAGLADDQRELALAVARALPAPPEEIELLLPPHEPRRRSRASPPAAACAHDVVERDRGRNAPERVRALVLGDEEARDLPLHGRSDENGSRFGEGLDARGDVRRLAEDLACRVDHDGTGVEADARGELGWPALVSGVELGERPLDRERGAHRPFGVVLLRMGIAEQRHQPVAEFLEQVPAERPSPPPRPRRDRS